MKTNNFKEIISGENGKLSSKRIMGTVVLIICLICTSWLVYKEGGTQVVENLLQTLMVMAAALLGISSVTSIWKKGVTPTEHKDVPVEDPCATCQYNKKEEVQ